MDGTEPLARTMDEDEVAALGPLPDPDHVSPTTDRDARPAAAATAEVHSPGVLESPPAEDDADDDRVPAPPPSIREED